MASRTQTPKITTVDQLEQTIADLVERVAALEAARCRCGTCNMDAEDREQNRRLARAGEILAMGADARNRELTALSGREFDNFVKVIQSSSDVISVAVEATPELRARIMPRVRGMLRRQIQLRLSPPPARVHVEQRPNIHVRQLEIQVDELNAARLVSAGLACDSRRTERGILHYYRRPELAGRWIYTTTQWDAQLAVDEQLRRLVDSGHVVATPLTEDQNVHYQIELEIEQRDARKYAEAPPELVATPYIDQ